MPRIRFAQRALQDLWDYDRWRDQLDHDREPAAILLRQAISIYLAELS